MNENSKTPEILNFAETADDWSNKYYNKNKYTKDFYDERQKYKPSISALEEIFYRFLEQKRRSLFGRVDFPTKRDAHVHDDDDDADLFDTKHHMQPH